MIELLYLIVLGLNEMNVSLFTMFVDIYRLGVSLCKVLLGG